MDASSVDSLFALAGALCVLLLAFGGWLSLSQGLGQRPRTVADAIPSLDGDSAPIATQS
jgi:hypothetical protein